MADGMGALHRPMCVECGATKDHKSHCSWSRNRGGSASYYELPQACKTLQDIIVKSGMDFTQGNIFKAAYRWDKKPDLEYNLNKIIWFAQDALDRLYAEHPDNPRRTHERQDQASEQ